MLVFPLAAGLEFPEMLGEYLCNILKAAVIDGDTSCVGFGEWRLTCWNPEPGTVTIPVFSNSSLQYRKSGDFPISLAACTTPAQ